MITWYETLSCVEGIINCTSLKGLGDKATGCICIIFLVYYLRSTKCKNYGLTIISKEHLQLNAFMQVEGVPALIHQTEVSWDATLDPASYFKVGQVFLSFTLSNNWNVWFISGAISTALNAACHWCFFSFAFLISCSKFWDDFSILR